MVISAGISKLLAQGNTPFHHSSNNNTSDTLKQSLLIRSHITKKIENPETTTKEKTKTQGTSNPRKINYLETNFKIKVKNLKNNIKWEIKTQEIITRGKIKIPKIITRGKIKTLKTIIKRKIMSRRTNTKRKMKLTMIITKRKTKLLRSTTKRRTMLRKTTKKEMKKTVETTNKRKTMLHEMTREPPKNQTKPERNQPQSKNALMKKVVMHWKPVIESPNFKLKNDRLNKHLLKRQKQSHPKKINTIIANTEMKWQQKMQQQSNQNFNTWVMTMIMKKKTKSNSLPQCPRIHAKAWIKYLRKTMRMGRGQNKSSRNLLFWWLPRNHQSLNLLHRH